MTFFAHLRTGARVGFITGVVSYSYLLWVVNRGDRHSYRVTYRSIEESAIFAVVGASTGAVLGGSLYGGKKAIHYMCKAPRSVQKIVGVTTTTILIMQATHHLGNREKR